MLTITALADETLTEAELAEINFLSAAEHLAEQSPAIARALVAYQSAARKAEDAARDAHALSDQLGAGWSKGDSMAKATANAEARAGAYRWLRECQKRADGLKLVLESAMKAAGRRVAA